MSTKILGNEELNILRAKTPYSLPDNPSDKGFNARQIKTKFWEGYLLLFNWLKETQASLNNDFATTNSALLNESKRIDVILTYFSNGKANFAVRDRNNNIIDETYELKSEASTKFNQLIADIQSVSSASGNKISGSQNINADGIQYTITLSNTQNATLSTITQYLPLATTLKAGLLSSTDKEKINNIESDLTNFLANAKAYTDEKLQRDNIVNILGAASHTLIGLLTSEDKKKIDALYALLGEQEDADTVVNTINEVLAIFSSYPEGVNIVSQLEKKVNYTDVINTLDSEEISKPLSAKMGKELKTKVDTKAELAYVNEELDKKALKSDILIIEEAVTAQESEITTTQNEGDKLVDEIVGYIDGSPRGVYASLSALQSAFPSGTQGVYVCSDNGHWYYWSGTTWTDGGVYIADPMYDELKKDLQTGNVGDNSITIHKMEKPFENSFTENLMDIELNIVNGYMTPTGEYAQSGYRTEINVSKGEVYSVRGTSGWNCRLVIMLNAENQIKYISDYENEQVTHDFDIKYIIPDGVTKIVVNSILNNLLVKKTESYSNIIKNNSVTDDNLVEDGVKKKVSDIENDLYSKTNNIFNLEKIVEKSQLAYWNNNFANIIVTKDTYTGRVSELIEVNEGEIYKSVNQYKSLVYGFQYVLFDVNLVNIGSSYESFVSSVTIPSNAKYIIFGFSNLENTPDAIVKVESLDSIPKYEPYKVKTFDKIYPENPLTNARDFGFYTSIFHRIGIIGDSLSNGHLEDVGDKREYSYPYCIGKMLGIDIKYFNKGGLSTSTWWTYNNGQFPNEVMDANNKCNAYLLGLGWNDGEMTTESLGNANDINLSDYNANNNTFYGRYAKIIQYIKSLYQHAKIFVYTSPDVQMEIDGRNDAIRNISKLFDDIYVLDFYKYEPFRDFNYSPYRLKPDGSYGFHLNVIGYKMVACKTISYIDYIVKNNINKFVDIYLSD